MKTDDGSSRGQPELRNQGVVDAVSPKAVVDFRRDGVTIVRRVLSPEWLAVVEAGIARNLANPGPHATTHFDDRPDLAIYDDRCNYENIPEYQRLVAESPLADVAAKLLGSENIWFYFDQIFVKAGGRLRRTPWHQDTPTYIAEGKQIAVCWITLDALDADESLEVVAGSHRGPMYSFPALDPQDETKPAHGSDGGPLPDITHERSKWDIRSFSNSPGDVLFFHPSALHGGGAIREGASRRTLSIRLFGDDVVYKDSQYEHIVTYPGLADVLKPGDPLRHPKLPKIRPRRQYRAGT